MRLLKALTVLLALSSVVALVIASRATPRPSTTIGAIHPAMNFAYVRIEGVVTAYPALSDRDEYLSFRLLDPTGEMRVTAYRAVVEQLLRWQRIPLPGDRVSVEGTLRVRDDEPSLILNTADGLTIATPPAQPIELSALAAMPLGDRVQTAGQVRRIRKVSDALQVLSVRDGDAIADAVVPLDLPLLREHPALTPGDWISVTGAVGEYRGERQVLSLAIQRLAFDPTPRDKHRRLIAELEPGLLGRWISVVGEVSDLRPFRQGMRVDLTDDSGATIVAVMFDSVWQAVPVSLTLGVGDRLWVQGELTEYRGRLEVVPQLGADVRAVED